MTAHRLCSRHRELGSHGRIASINLPLKDGEHKYHWPLGRRIDDHQSAQRTRKRSNNWNKLTLTAMSSAWGALNLTCKRQRRSQL